MASIAIRGGGGANKYFGGPVQTRLGQKKKEQDAGFAAAGPGTTANTTMSTQPTAQPAAPTSLPAPQAMPSQGLELGDAGPTGRQPIALPGTAGTATQGPKVPRPMGAQPTATTAGNRANVGTGQMGQQLWQNAMGAMKNPSRYDAKLVRQGAKVIEDTIARMRQAGTRNVGEWAAGRGLIGSSLEGERMTDLEGVLDSQAREMAFNLQREQANTYGADRNSAFGMGLGTAGFNEGRQARLGNEDYRNRALEQDRYFGERNADRADVDTAGRWTDAFSPEVLEQAGIPTNTGPTAQPASQPVSQAPLDPTSDPGYGQLFGEGWWDGTPEGERSFRKYFGQN